MQSSANDRTHIGQMRCVLRECHNCFHFLTLGFVVLKMRDLDTAAEVCYLRVPEQSPLKAEMFSGRSREDGARVERSDIPDAKSIYRQQPLLECQVVNHVSLIAEYLH